MEVWKDIKGYEGHYKVSDLGRVKSIKFNKEKMIKQSIVSSGYYGFTLHKEGKSKNKQVHQLVAIAFLNHTPDGHKITVDHINGDKLNNKLSNIRLLTQRENSQEYYKKIKSSSVYVGVSWHSKCEKWRATMALNGKQKCLGLFKDARKASLAYQQELSIIKND